jgi:hypothetical protein
MLFVNHLTLHYQVLISLYLIRINQSIFKSRQIKLNRFMEVALKLLKLDDEEEEMRICYL